MPTRPVRRLAPLRPLPTGPAPRSPLVPALLACLLLLTGGLPLAALAAPEMAPGAAPGSGDLETVIYDVSDLLHRRPDYPAPRLGLGKFDPTPLDPDESDATPWTMETLVDLLERALGDELVAEGRAIRPVGKQLVITVPPAAHTSVATVIDALRKNGAIAYTIEAHWLAWDTETLATHGLAESSGSRARAARRLTPETGTALLAAAAADRSAELILSPRLTIFADQRSHYAFVEQGIVVDGMEIGPSGEPTERQLEVVTTGVTFETRVSPRRRGRGVLLRYDLQIARPLPTDPSEVAAAHASGEPELDAPEIEMVRRQGRKGLAEGEWLVLRSLPHPNGEREQAEGRETLLLVRCLRAEGIPGASGGGERSRENGR